MAMLEALSRKYAYGGLNAHLGRLVVMASNVMAFGAHKSPGDVVYVHSPKVPLIISPSYLILLCPMVGDRSVNQTSCLCRILKKPVSRAAKIP